MQGLIWLLIGIVIILVIRQQRIDSPDGETAERWHKDPNNWKGGFFYFNPKDKRLFPPKRFPGMGWTINFANPFSYVAIVGVIILLEILMTTVF
jgi:uncharacterized membrane protein